MVELQLVVPCLERAGPCAFRKADALLWCCYPRFVERPLQMGEEVKSVYACMKGGLA
jgi:hypothetical protein